MARVSAPLMRSWGQGRPQPCLVVPSRDPTYHLQPSTVCHSLDYVAANSDEGVLRYPPRTELSANEVCYVFGWPRNLTEKYFIGRVIGKLRSSPDLMQTRRPLPRAQQGLRRLNHAQMRAP